MKKFLLLTLLCVLTCYSTSTLENKQVQSLTFASIEDILPLFPLIYNKWKVEKSTESINNDIKSVSYLLSDTVGIVATGNITGEISNIVAFVNYDKKSVERDDVVNFFEDSARAVNVIGFMSIKDFISKKNIRLKEKLIMYLSLTNTDILKGKSVGVNIKRQGVKLEAKLVDGTYYITADAVD